MWSEVYLFGYLDSTIFIDAYDDFSGNPIIATKEIQLSSDFVTNYILIAIYSSLIYSSSNEHY